MNDEKNDIQQVTKNSQQNDYELKKDLCSILAASSKLNNLNFLYNFFSGLKFMKMQSNCFF